MSTGNLILVVENEPGTARLMTIILEAAGYTVQHTADGQAALKLIAAIDPALMILDIHLPAMSGWKVLEALGAEKLAHLPVLVMSADILAESDAKAYNICAYLDKPFVPDKLLEVVQQCIAGTYR